MSMPKLSWVEVVELLGSPIKCKSNDNYWKCMFVDFLAKAYVLPNVVPIESEACK